MKYLLFDITNILYRTFYAHKTDDDITVAGLAHHTAFTTINKYFKLYKPDKMIMCFDRSNWRKKYTQTEECISGKLYKGNRRKKMTPKEKERYKLFLNHITDFENLIREHTSIVALAERGLEADDLLAGFAQFYSCPENEMVIVSSDKDLIQLLEYENVRLINPMDGKDRDLKEWNDDPGLFIFEKCIRGDVGDNVQSALPRCRKTRIHKAYDDSYEFANLMHEIWTNPDGKEMVVKELFKENMLLMDLKSQPPNIRSSILSTIEEGIENPGRFDYFKFINFLGKYELHKLSKQAELFIPMLSL